TLLFYSGVLVSYFLIFPLSVNFLASYQVAAQVDNLVDLDSYIDTLISLTLSLGAVFELPVLAYFLSKIGILSYSFMKNHRKHAFVFVLFLAAIITPGTDIFTMLLTALPLQLVYELSVMIVRRNEK
ncbi:MAG: twin-arginine translocase subunit TatC, partial [Bacteroidales bacterium]|nr:twin-arginine translocase subunit TatC [Bacteroidales bacterium]